MYIYINTYICIYISLYIYTYIYLWLLNNVWCTFVLNDMRSPWLICDFGLVTNSHVRHRWITNFKYQSTHINAHLCGLIRAVRDSSVMWTHTCGLISEVCDSSTMCDAHLCGLICRVSYSSVTHMWVCDWSVLIDMLSPWLIYDVGTHLWIDLSSSWLSVTWEHNCVQWCMRSVTNPCRWMRGLCDSPVISTNFCVDRYEEFVTHHSWLIHGVHDSSAICRTSGSAFSSCKALGPYVRGSEQVCGFQKQNSTHTHNAHNSLLVPAMKGAGPVCLSARGSKQVCGSKESSITTHTAHNRLLVLATKGAETLGSTTRCVTSWHIHQWDTNSIYLDIESCHGII